MSYADPAYPPGLLGWLRDRDRRRSVIGVVLIHLLLGFALLRGLGVSMPATVSTGLTLVNLLPPPPPPPVEKPKPPRSHTSRKSGAASPPNLRSKATEVVAPPPPPVPVPPPPVVTAPKANIGIEHSTGAADIAGPGTGAGGVGNGTGSGDEGDGEGDGNDGDLRWISGRIKDSDYPKSALRAGIGGVVGLRFTVGVAGRVTDCTVTRSSGNADLDATTCRLIQKRFRYAPARDRSGRPVPTEITGEHRWNVYGGPDQGDDDPGD